MQLSFFHPTLSCLRKKSHSHHRIVDPVDNTFSAVFFFSLLIYFFGRLAPYLDLDCNLPSTPEVSKAPLTM